MAKQDLSPLVLAAQRGDQQALSDLLEASYRDLYFYAYQTVKNEDLAADITQESCLEIISTISQLREPNAFVVWARRITYHQCTRFFRESKEVTVEANEEGETIFDQIPDENEGVLPEQVQLDKEFRATMQQLLDELPAQQRTALMLYYYEKLSVSQIAQIQDATEGTVKSRLNYGRKAVKAKVEEYEKKTGLRLHSIAPLPLLLFFLFGRQSAAAMASASLGSVPAVLSGSIAAGAGTAAGTAATGAAAGTAAATGTAVTTGADAAAAATGISLGTKIAAGAVAAAVCIGGAIGGIALLKDNAPAEATAPVQQIELDPYLLGTWHAYEYPEGGYDTTDGVYENFTLYTDGTLQYLDSTYYLTEYSFTANDDPDTQAEDPYSYFLYFSEDPSDLYTATEDYDLHIHYRLLHFFDGDFHGADLYCSTADHGGFFLKPGENLNGPPQLNLPSVEAETAEDPDPYGAKAHWDKHLGQWRSVLPEKDGSVATFQILPDYTILYNGVTYQQRIQHSPYTEADPFEAEAANGNVLQIFPKAGPDGNRWLEVFLLIPYAEGSYDPHPTGNFYLPDEYANYDVITLTTENFWNYVEEPEFFEIGSAQNYLDGYFIFRDGLASASRCRVIADMGSVHSGESYFVIPFDGPLDSKWVPGIFEDAPMTVRHAFENPAMEEGPGLTSEYTEYIHCQRIEEVTGTVFVPKDYQIPAQRTSSLPAVLSGQWTSEYAQMGDYFPGIFRYFIMNPDGTVTTDAGTLHWLHITQFSTGAETALYMVTLVPEECARLGIASPYLMFRLLNNGQYGGLYLKWTDATHEWTNYSELFLP